MYGKQLEQYLIKDSVAEFLEYGVLLAAHFDKDTLKTPASLFLNSWIVPSIESVKSSLFESLSKVMSVEQANSEKYSKTVGYIDTIIGLTLQRYAITDE